MTFDRFSMPFCEFIYFSLHSLMPRAIYKLFSLHISIYFACVAIDFILITANYFTWILLAISPVLQALADSLLPFKMWGSVSYFRWRTPPPYAPPGDYSWSTDLHNFPLGSIKYFWFWFRFLTCTTHRNPVIPCCSWLLLQLCQRSIRLPVLVAERMKRNPVWCWGGNWYLMWSVRLCASRCVNSVVCVK